MAGTKTFRYRDNTGGCNLLASDFLINESEQATEMALILNMDTYQEGGFKAQLGNRQLNASVTDTTAILGIGQYQDGNGAFWAIYTKASGKAYVMAEAGGAETEIKTGLSTTAIPMFVEFDGKVWCFNGADTPWSWDGATAANVTTPPASWSSQKPHIATVVDGGRILAAAGSTLYWCKQGDGNDWTATSDAGSVTEPYGDTADIRALAEYGSRVSVHTGKNRVYLFAGNTPDTYALARVASNQSAAGRFGVCTVNANQYFYTQNSILPLVTTDLGVVKLGDSVDLSRKISPFINGELESATSFGTVDSGTHADAILLPYDLKKELVCYFKTEAGSTYSTAAIFNFNRGGWVFRQMTHITAAALVNGKIFTGTTDGKILQEFTGSSVVGSSSITKRLVSPYLSFGAPEVKKRITRMWIWFRSSSPIPATLKFRVNYQEGVVEEREILITLDQNSVYGQAVYGEGLYAVATTVLENFPTNLTAESIQWELVSTEALFDFRVSAYAFEVEYLDEY